MWRIHFDVNAPVWRRFKERRDPFDMLHDEEFLERYRFPKDVVSDLCEELSPFLLHYTGRSHSLTVEQQVCAALRFYSHGGYLPVIADLHRLSERTASRTIHAVSEALSRIHHRYIKWPTGNKYFFQCWYISIDVRMNISIPVRTIWWLGWKHFCSRKSEKSWQKFTKSWPGQLLVALFMTCAGRQDY